MSIVLVGSTSGSITLQEPAVAGTTVLDLPATSGTVVVSGTTPSLNGITFPATQSASADANTLDDYEEGTWTPRNSSGSALSCNGTPRYIKIGRQVFIHCDINQISQDSIYNLPFTALATGAYPGTVHIAYNTYVAGPLGGIVDGNSTRVYLYYNGGTAASPSNARIICSGVYESAS